MSGLWVAHAILRAMKRKSSTDAKAGGTTASKPEKMLLHMALKDGDWAGKATSFERRVHFKFSNLQELIQWIQRLPKR